MLTEGGIPAIKVRTDEARLGYTFNLARMLTCVVYDC